MGGGVSRQLRVLLVPWVMPGAIEGLYRILRIEEPATPRDFYEMVARRREIVSARGSVMFTLAGGVQPMDDAVLPLAGEVLASGTYRDRYAYLGGDIVRVPLSGLLTPQVSADWDYVDQLTAGLPASGDEEALFRLCFGDDDVAEPLLVSAGAIQSATLKLERNQPPWVGPLRASHSPGRVTLSVDIEARGRYVQLGVVPLPSGQVRIVVINGVHRLLALLQAGRDHAYALVRTMSAHELQASFEPSPATITDATGMQWPARLDDFLDDTLFDVVRQTVVQVHLRILVHSDTVVTVGPETAPEDGEPAGEVVGTIVERFRAAEDGALPVPADAAPGGNPAVISQQE